jgi:type II secretory pathway component PulF
MAVGVQATAFRYRAARADGTLTNGRLSAESADAVADQLNRQGLFLLEIRRARTFALPPRRVSRQDLAVVFRNVAALVRAGMPVERALAASESLVSGSLEESLVQVRRRLREGHGVAVALAGSHDVFPRVVVGMVQAGERASRLSEALDGVASQLEEEAALRAQVRSALAYPALILVVGVVSVIIMGGVVVPRFAEVLAELGAALPPSTRALLAASNILRRFGLAGALGAAGLAAAGASALRRPRIRRRVDRALLRVPIVGSIRLGFASARTCRALGAMLRTGMPLLSALDAARDAAGDTEVAERLARAREAVARGERLTQSLERERALAPIALQLVGVGESSGDLGAMVSRAGDLTSERTARSLRGMVNLLEPALVILMGLLVALTAGALLQAVYSVRPGV